MKVKVSQSCPTLNSPWNSQGQNTGVGSFIPSPEDLPNPGVEPRSPALRAYFLPAEPQGKPKNTRVGSLSKPKNTRVGSLSLLQGIFLTQESNWSLLHCRRILYQLSYHRSPGKESACNAGTPGWIPRSGRSPGGGYGNPLQDSCLGNPMDRGAWWATVHGVTESRTRLGNFHFHSLGVADARGTVSPGARGRELFPERLREGLRMQDLSGDGLGTPTELNGRAPGTPAGFPGIRRPNLHSMFCFGSRLRKVVSVPGVTKYYNLWRKQKVRGATCVEKKSEGCVCVSFQLPN